MSQLVLKRASASRPSGQWQDEDYDVLADGEVVGRILESGSRFDPPDLLWTWSITSIWPATRGVTNGTAATREEAMAKFRTAWEAARKPSLSEAFGLTPSRVNHPARQRT